MAAENSCKSGQELVSCINFDSDGVWCTYAQSDYFEATLDYMAKKIKSKNCSRNRILVICENDKEAEEFKKELAQREVEAFLLRLDQEMVENWIKLWSAGYAPNKILIVCDEMLQLLKSSEIKYIIHSKMIQSEEVLQKHLELLKRSRPGSELLIIGNLQEKSNEKEYKEKETLPEVKVRPKEENEESKEEEPKVTDESPVKKACDLKEEEPPLSDLMASPQMVNLPPFKEATQGQYYNNFGILAWSQQFLMPCFDIGSITPMDEAIKSLMRSPEFDIKRAFGVQRYAWPHLSAGHSLILLGHERTGKSWSYLPILCQRTYDFALQHENPTWFGPISLVVVANPKQGEHLSKVLLKLMEFTKEKTKIDLLVTLWNRFDIPEVVNRLEHPCGIFVTTVEMLNLLRLDQRRKRPLLQPSAVRCLVLDNLDDQYRCLPLDVLKLINWLQQQLTFEEDFTQLIITARLWLEQLMRQQLMPLLSDLLLIFEDALEASIYGRINLDLKILSEEDYLNGTSLIKLISSHQGQHESLIVIMCHLETEASSISDLLKHYHVSHQLCSYTSERLINSGVLIVPDEMVPKLPCGPVSLLIHYTPSNSWRRLKQRFSLFYPNFRAGLESIRHASSVVFIRPSDMNSGWLFCDFMLKHHLDMSQSWLDFVHEQRLSTESPLTRLKQPLCMQLTRYGNCYRRQCQYRHQIHKNEVQSPRHADEMKKEIQFYLLNCLSPASLTVRLADRPTMPQSEFCKRLQLHYEDQENRQPHPNPKVGDLCVIKHHNGYERVAVINVNNIQKVEVKQLDVGTNTTTLAASELFACDDLFRHHEFEAVELCLTGISPYSMERIWTDDAKRLTRNKFFHEVAGKSRYFSATVDFTFNDTIFVENVFDEYGNDLRGFALDHLKVYQDDQAKERLLKLAKEAK